MRLKVKWIALKGVMSGKPHFTHHNKSSPLMPVYIHWNTLATGFSLFTFSAFSVLCRWRPGLCNSRQKWLTASSNVLLGGFRGCVRSSQRLGEFPGNGRRFAFIVAQCPLGPYHCTHKSKFPSVQSDRSHWVPRIPPLADKFSFLHLVATTTLSAVWCVGGFVRLFVVVILLNKEVCPADGNS